MADMVLEYNCGDGAWLKLCRGSSAEEYEKFCQQLLGEGCTLYAKNDIAGNQHTYFTKGDAGVNVWFTPADSSLRVVNEPKAGLYPLEPFKGERVCPTTLWQFEVDHSLIDCGMCYIIQCADGGFFVIDSAHTYSIHDDERIYNFLRERTPKGKKIVIHGWFFSHGHVDHIGKFMDFLRYDMSNVEIEALYFNLVPGDHPDNGYWEISDKKFTQAFVSLVNGCRIPIIKLHTGMRFCVCDLEFEVLCTHEDVFPGSMKNYNDSSTVICMTACGTKVMFPGDAGDEEDKILVSRYGEYLKSDIIQVAHHGHFGCSTEFYRLVSAPLALFPTTQIKYDEEFENYEANRVCVAISQDCYIASNGTVEIPLPYECGKEKVLPDETFEDFDGIYDLWAYEYSDERKNELYDAYLKRGGKPCKKNNEV